MLKNLTKLVDVEDESVWRLDNRTKGPEITSSETGKTAATWVLIFSNPNGERRFVPEHRVWEFFKKPESES